MKPSTYWLLPTLFLYCTVGCEALGDEVVTGQLRNGDLIFQTSQSSQTDLIQEVTQSNLSHVGVIYYKDNEPYVFEAIGPVVLTPLAEWIERGKGADYIVSRLTRELTDAEQQNMYHYARKQLGKSYDIQFKWSDSKMYCSELVWKAYEAGGIRLCEPKQFKDFDLSSDAVQQAIKQRYVSDFNDRERVVAPSDLYESDKLEVIFDTY